MLTLKKYVYVVLLVLVWQTSRDDSDDVICQRPPDRRALTGASLSPQEKTNRSPLSCSVQRPVSQAAKFRSSEVLQSYFPGKKKRWKSYIRVVGVLPRAQVKQGDLSRRHRTYCRCYHLSSVVKRWHLELTCDPRGNEVTSGVNVEEEKCHLRSRKTLKEMNNGILR